MSLGRPSSLTCRSCYFHLPLPRKVSPPSRTSARCPPALFRQFFAYHLTPSDCLHVPISVTKVYLKKKKKKVKKRKEKKERLTFFLTLCRGVFDFSACLWLFSFACTSVFQTAVSARVPLSSIILPPVSPPACFVLFPSLCLHLHAPSIFIPVSLSALHASLRHLLPSRHAIPPQPARLPDLCSRALDSYCLRVACAVCRVLLFFSWVNSSFQLISLIRSVRVDYYPYFSFPSFPFLLPPLRGVTHQPTLPSESTAYIGTANFCNLAT